MSLPAQAFDLCLSADVAADLGVTADDRVQRAVSAASRAIADYCARTFEKNAAIVEYPDSTGRPLLVLKRPPVASIASITEWGSTVDSAAYECVGPNADAGLVNRLSGSWSSTERPDPFAVTDQVLGSYGQSNRIVVTYSGGFVTSGQNALDSATYPTVTLPDPVREAAVQTAVALLKLRGVDPSVSLEAIGDWQIRYYERKAGEMIPPFAQALLAPYKLGWFA